MTSIIQKAKDFATIAHQNQTEKDVYKTPYIFHLQRVAKLVQLSGGSEEEIASAWLHDTIEDTTTTIEDIKNEFGNQIAKIVDGLTDLPEWSKLSDIDRKLAQAARVSEESKSVRRVKLADQISGGELDARNTLYDINTRRKLFEGVTIVAQACRGISEGLDNLFDEISIEIKWFFDHS